MHLVLLHRATLKLMRKLTNDIGIRQLVLANKQNLILAQVEKNPLTEHEHESYVSCPLYILQVQQHITYEQMYVALGMS